VLAVLVLSKIMSAYHINVSALLYIRMLSHWRRLNC